MIAMTVPGVEAHDLKSVAGQTREVPIGVAGRDLAARRLAGVNCQCRDRGGSQNCTDEVALSASPKSAAKSTEAANRRRSLIVIRSNQSRSFRVIVQKPREYGDCCQQIVNIRAIVRVRSIRSFVRTG